MCTSQHETRFSVLLGIAVETLCSKTSYVGDTTVQTCVKALIAILSTEWCQMQLMSDVQQAGIILDSALMAIRINSSSNVENGIVEMPVNFPLYSGKDGDHGTLHGTLSFALMELCLCLFVRQMPQINSAQMKSRSIAPLHLRKCGRLLPESTNLVRSTGQLLVQIPQLTGAESRLLLLPIILYLLVAFIRESARIDENCVVPDLPPGHLSISIASGESRYDRCVILLSCVVMASAAPKSVVLGHSKSFHRLVRLMREQLQSEHPKVVCKALQSLASLFSRKDSSMAFVKNLGEDVFNVMKPFVVGQTVSKMLTDVSDNQLLMLQKAEKVVESLAHIANERKHPPIVSLLTQFLCRLLLPTAAEEWRQMSPASRGLHDFAIGRLNVVAPTWPAEFKSILAAHPELKKRLEGALVFQASRNALALQTARAKQAENKTANSQQQQPTIKLRMDFNAFQKA